MTEMDTPATKQEIVDLMTFVIIETVAVLSPDTKVADEQLEDVASRLLSMADGLGAAPGSALLIRATAQQLIQTEAGTGD